MERWLTLLMSLVSIVAGALLAWIIGKIQRRRERADLEKMLKNALLDREHVSVNEEFLMTELLAERIQKDEYKPDVIFAVCPGGAMIAEWLSRRFLGNRSVPIPVQLLYMRRKQERTQVASVDMAEVDDVLTQISSGLSKNSKVLLINDISRGGHTLYSASNFLTKHFPSGEIRSAALICRKDANVTPTYCVAATTKAVRFDWKSYGQ